MTMILSILCSSDRACVGRVARPFLPVRRSCRSCSSAVLVPLPLIMDRCWQTLRSEIDEAVLMTQAHVDLVPPSIVDTMWADIEMRIRRRKAFM